VRDSLHSDGSARAPANFILFSAEQREVLTGSMPCLRALLRRSQGPRHIWQVLRSCCDLLLGDGHLRRWLSRYGPPARAGVARFRGRRVSNWLTQKHPRSRSACGR